MNKGLLLSVLLTTLFCLAVIIRKFFKAKESRSHILIIWNAAREARLSWKNSKKYGYDFYDPEYQKLFDEELKWEAVYILQNEKPWIERSLREYRIERLQKEQDEK